jgi:hypothetical protein
MFLLFTETRKTNMNAATACVHVTEMITQADSSSHPTRHDNFVGDATVEKEGAGVYLNTVKGDPESEYKYEAPAMVTSEVSKSATAINTNIPYTESAPFQVAEVGNSPNDVQVLDYHDKCEAVPREMANLQEVWEDNKVKKDNAIRSLEDISDKN